MIAIDYVLLLANLLVALPVSVVLLQVVAALVGRRGTSVGNDGPASANDFAVLVPAHNESAVLGEALTSMCRHVRDPRQILVIADNCQDDTAAVAARGGVQVVERHDDVNVGKGHALDYGVRFLTTRNSLPAVVIVIDADCHVSGAKLEDVAERAAERDRPLQLLNITDRESPADSRAAVAQLGNALTNHVRPLGMSNLGGPCQLMGTGMVIPSHLISQGQLATSSNAEDKQLGVRLALQGYPPVFCDAAQVSSQLPPGKEAFLTQRTRWEHGHLSVACWGVPRLLIAGLRQRRCSLLAMAIDLAIPPMALIVGAWAGLLLAGAIFFAFQGVWGPLTASGGIGVMLGAIVVATWWSFGRKQIPFWRLAGIPFYLAGKLPIYMRLIRSGREKRWLRTDRQSSTIVGSAESTLPPVDTRDAS